MKKFHVILTTLIVVIAMTGLAILIISRTHHNPMPLKKLGAVSSPAESAQDLTTADLISKKRSLHTSFDIQQLRDDEKVTASDPVLVRQGNEYLEKKVETSTVTVDAAYYNAQIAAVEAQIARLEDRKTKLQSLKASIH